MERQPMFVRYLGELPEYAVLFEGNFISTTVTARAHTASEWVQRITDLYGRSPKLVGLAVEWRHIPFPGFPRRKIATLQLCTDMDCLILQLKYMGVSEIPDSIREFLMNPNFTFVGVRVDEDVDKLRADYGLECRNTMDVRAKAVSRWPERYGGQVPSLRDLARDLCGFDLANPEHVRMSYWEGRALCFEQILYAVTEAFVYFRIGVVVDPPSDYLANPNNVLDFELPRVRKLK